MNTWVLGLSIAVALLAAALGIVLFRILSYRRPSAEETIPEFSLSRYQCMTQLMSDDDAQFWGEQQGVSRSVKQRFRRNRRKVFRLYLQELAFDFRQLHRRAREIAAHAPEGNGNLVGSLMRLQVDFWRFMVLIETQLLLDQFGIGSVDSGRLLETIQSLHLAVSRTSSNPGPVMV
jgi:hypothetical protein